jgi:ferredoxin-thioredoxin reductase catalytic subunit
MFEISGNDISSLDDADLRSLVARLAIAEMGAKGYPVSSVTAGGDQDAADGGLDVRVECPTEITNPDFVPRRLTGFQVKKPDMRPGGIGKEMRPNGVLRDVIRQLADRSGAYVIVSAQGSVADKPLADRRQAIRDALFDLPKAAQIHSDFYDRNRVATWVNQYPGIAAWVRSRVGRPLSGWSGIGNWEGRGIGNLKPYLYNDNACLIDERARDSKHVTITEGITRLRNALRTPRQCIRLIGLSGVGKTRLVQALFEQNVGTDPLDPSLAVYTDYSEETKPTARDMARDLIARRQRAILVVDNCNPNTHSELARLCASDASEVSLITVEYDVRDDEPEQTDVFRLQSASPDLVTEWIKQSFPDVSDVDREKIAAFSNGNFRVAAALAQTVGKGETLGSLKSRELFERIFRQRNEPDRQLLQAAEDLSLLYSIDGEDISDEGELAHVGTIRSVGARPLYEALAGMRQRGVVQARGHFRAILPQAIANALAAHALERIPPADFDQFCVRLPPRMLKSISRRLGYLHDSRIAQSTVMRWLQVDGPLGDLIASDAGFQAITNIAPVAPEAALARLERHLVGLPPDVRLEHRWASLIKAIGYDAHLFDRAVTLLARFAAAEPENNNLNSARNTFSELFHLYLSGTQASPKQRRSAIRRLAASDDENLRRSAHIALKALLKSSHFMSAGSHDFGARPRDWGWHPKFNKDVWDWFEDAIALVTELASDADARALLAESVRELWHYPTCRDALDRAATTFLEKGPWVEGWIAFRATLRFDGKDMPNDIRAKLEQIINRLKPTDLLNQARAVVLNRMPGGGGWDFAEGEDDEDDAIRAWEKADRMAQEVGRRLASDAEVRAQFLTELLTQPQALRALECGCGLAEGADDLNAIWLELATAYRAAESRMRNATALGGFIYEAHQRDQSFTSAALEAAIEDPALAPILPYLQARIGIDAEGIERLRRAVAKGVLVAANFQSIANGSVSKSPPESLAALLEDISTLCEGVEIALDVLNMHFYSNREGTNNCNVRLVSVGRDLLVRANFSRDSPLRDFAAHTVILICLTGDEGRPAAEKLCRHVCSALDAYQVSPHNLSYIFKALLETQPFVTLDVFLLSPSPYGIHHRFDMDFTMGPSVESVNPAILQKWASRDPQARYPLLGKCLNMFRKENNEEQNEISPLFLSMLDNAPDKRLFLGDLGNRVHPRSWGGSLAHILEKRKTQVMKLAEHSDTQVRAWVADLMPELDRSIANARESDRATEESFE